MGFLPSTDANTETCMHAHTHLDIAQAKAVKQVIPLKKDREELDCIDRKSSDPWTRTDMLVMGR